MRGSFQMNKYFRVLLLDNYKIMWIEIYKRGYIDDADFIERIIFELSYPKELEMWINKEKPELLRSKKK